MSLPAFNAGRLLEANLWASQAGAGQNLDITGGKPAIVYALSLAAAGAEPLSPQVDTRVRFYDSTTASGTYIELYCADSINFTYTLDLPWGIRFGNGISIDMTEAGDHAVQGDVGWAYVVYKVIP